jgi:hypothetical protein
MYDEHIGIILVIETNGRLILKRVVPRNELRIDGPLIDSVTAPTDRPSQFSRANPPLLPSGTRASRRNAARLAALICEGKGLLHASDPASNVRRA